MWLWQDKVEPANQTRKAGLWKTTRTNPGSQDQNIFNTSSWVFCIEWFWLCKGQSFRSGLHCTAHKYSNPPCSQEVFLNNSVLSPCSLWHGFSHCFMRSFRITGHSTAFMSERQGTDLCLVYLPSDLNLSQVIKRFGDLKRYLRPTANVQKPQQEGQERRQYSVRADNSKYNKCQLTNLIWVLFFSVRSDSLPADICYFRLFIQGQTVN